LEEIKNVRNIALISHGEAGKTSLVEAMLHNSGEINRLGKVEEGNTVSDYDPEEIKRKISIDSTVLFCKWKDWGMNIIDTPGYADFVGEVKSSLRITDSALVLISAVSGVEVHTENVWRYADEHNLPRFIFLNKMDRDNAQFQESLNSIRDVLSPQALLFQLPIGEGAGFKGVVDLVEMKSYTFEGGKMSEGEVPEDLKEKAASSREKLMEAVAEGDDSLIEKYLESGELSLEEMKEGLKRAILARKIIPVLCGSALKSIAVEPLLNFMGNYAPSPLDRGEILGTNPKTGEKEARKPDPNEAFSALVFKTISEPHIGDLILLRVYSGTLSSGSEAYNSSKKGKERIGQLLRLKGKEREEVSKVLPGEITAVAKLKNTSTGDTLCDSKKLLILEPINFPQPLISVAIKPKTKKDQERLSGGMAKFAEVDPTFKVKIEHEFGETVASGIGELHLEVVLSRLKERFGLEVDVGKPRVPYRETVRATAEVQGKYKKQSGGRGQYGDTWLRIEPLPAGGGFEFVNKIFGGAIPVKYVPAVEKGVKEAMGKGILAGYPITDLRVTLYDGSFHNVDSSDLAFQIAASLAFKKGFLGARPVLLEPIMKVEVIAPENYMGDINNDLSSRRGRITGVESRGNNQAVKANIPLAEMYKYSTDLRSLTHGTGTYTMEFSSYEEVPSQISAKVIDEAKKEKEES
jgi:elongation factor G